MNIVEIDMDLKDDYENITGEYNTIYILEEDYKRLGFDINDEEEGKSYYGTLYIDIITDERQSNYCFNLEKDEVYNRFSVLYDELSDRVKTFEFSLRDAIKKAEEYINTLDYKQEVTYCLHKSQIKKVDEFIKSLNK